MLQDIIQALQSAGLLLADHLIAIILGLAVVYIKRWTGIQIEDKHMRALHSAAVTGVRLAIESGLDGPRLREAAIAYMRESVPDAIRALVGSNTSILANLVQSKISQALRPG